MFINYDEEDLEFDLNYTDHDSYLTLLTTDQKTLEKVGQMQKQEAEQKCMVFEATELSICQNKRAHIRKMNFAIGECVLFRNPDAHGLVSTLNVRGCVKEKVGRDLLIQSTVST